MAKNIEVGARDWVCDNPSLKSKLSLQVNFGGESNYQAAEPDRKMLRRSLLGTRSGKK